MSLLKVDQITYRIRDTKILQDVSLDVERGDLIGLIGPNGAGKSTLMRVMAGLIAPTKGSVYLDSRPLHSFGEKERARAIAYVSQSPQVGFGFSVEDVVTMGRYAHRGRFEELKPLDLETIESAMQQAGVTALRKRKITEISGGERQRVFLARAIAQKPRLFLLDEPTANLDIRYQLDLLSLIGDLNHTNGLTVLMAVHDLNLALHYCHSLIALSHGRVVAYGRPRDVITTEMIREVFGVTARVETDPTSGDPVRVEYLGTA